MFKKYIAAFTILAVLLLIACAYEVKRIPSGLVLVPSSEGESIKSIYLSENVIVDLSTGYKRTLKQSTRWDFVGKIAEGDIYKPHGQVLTVEGAHVHEAYIVIYNAQLIGFYLPVEKAFSPISTKLSLPIK